MKARWSKVIKRQAGFTLIELLVVIGVLGTLAAVSVPAYNKFFGSGKQEAGATELASVQAAIDAMMAAKQIVAVAPQALAVGDFAALPTGTGSDPLSPGYLRINPTRCTYTWDGTGRVAQGACP